MIHIMLGIRSTNRGRNIQKVYKTSKGVTNWEEQTEFSIVLGLFALLRAHTFK